MACRLYKGHVSKTEFIERFAGYKKSPVILHKDWQTNFNTVKDIVVLYIYIYLFYLIIY